MGRRKFGGKYGRALFVDISQNIGLDDGDKTIDFKIIDVGFDPFKNAKNSWPSCCASAISSKLTILGVLIVETRHRQSATVFNLPLLWRISVENCAT